LKGGKRLKKKHESDISGCYLAREGDKDDKGWEGKGSKGL